MEQFKFNKISINILRRICDDLSNDKNPIKYHNMLFNNAWSKHNDSVHKLYLIMKTHLNNIINQNRVKDIINKNISNISWSNIFHDEPFNYMHYVDRNNISFPDFDIKYQKKDINLKNINYVSFIKKFTDLSDVLLIDKLNYFQNGYFVGLDSKLYVENNINRYEQYDFEHMDFHFFFSDKIGQTDKNMLIYQIYIVSNWIYTLFDNSNKKIKFVYFDTPLKKNINRSNNFLSSQNVNSGLSSTGRIIMIWRREELLKVLIHEMIHYLDIDVKYDNNFNKIINFNIGEIDYPILLNETITEIQAQFFHTIYQSILINNSMKSTDILTDIATFNTLYNYEQIFSWYQFSKIMEFYSIRKFKRKHIIKKFNQASNVFSYYILKSIFSLDFGDIIFKLNHIQKLIVDPSNYICKSDNCQILVNHMTNILNKPPKNFLNKMIKNLDLSDDSLRMTIFG